MPDGPKRRVRLTLAPEPGRSALAERWSLGDAPTAMGARRGPPRADANLAAAITRAASRQTYATIRLLVDRSRVEDAFRAYAYFRWVDDVLDAPAPVDRLGSDVARAERERFLARQRWLLDACLRGDPAEGVSPHEAMLVDLVRHADRSDGRIESYLRHMLLVMDFDVRRRGRLVSEAELSDYTRWLAIAVTAAMRHFIGNAAAAPDDEAGYPAVSGAHVLHMLRDTGADLQAGYFNIPREWLDRYAIGPGDVHCDAYREWVAARVGLARADFVAGRSYFRQVRSLRHRVAGLAYMARFERLIAQLERDDYRIRPRYDDEASAATALRMGALTAAGLLGLRDHERRPSANAIRERTRA